MKLFDKLFCKHEWKSHTKERYKWDEKRMVAGTASWYNPVWETHTFSSVTEVLICKKCGRVKKIEY